MSRFSMHGGGVGSGAGSGAGAGAGANVLLGSNARTPSEIDFSRPASSTSSSRTCREPLLSCQDSECREPETHAACALATRQRSAAGREERAGIGPHRFVQRLPRLARAECPSRVQRGAVICGGGREARHCRVLATAAGLGGARVVPRPTDTLGQPCNGRQRTTHRHEDKCIVVCLDRRPPNDFWKGASSRKSCRTQTKNDNDHVFCGSGIHV